MVAPTSAGSEQSAHIEEVIVTAQRRTQTAQKTALALTAITGASLTRSGAVDVTRLNDIAPSVQVQDRGSGVNIAIRGVVTANPSPQGDPSLAFNIDDVYVARPQASNGIFYDVNRVEVLRGPQGTVYGRNATAGAINVITNDPTNRYQAEGAIELGDYNLNSFYGMVNIPITDTLAVRGAFNTLNHTGYIGNRFDDAKDFAGRLKTLWKPTTDLSILLSADAFHKGGHGTGDVIYPFVSDAHPYDNTAYPSNYGHWVDDQFSVSGHIDYNLNFATLTYIGAFRRLDDLQDNAQNGALGIGEHYVADQDTQEVRLASNAKSNTAGTLKWVAGFYYFNEDQSQFGVIEQPFFPKTYAPVLIHNTLVEPNIHSDSKAGFAQATYSVLGWLRATGGIRYTEDHKSENGYELINLGPQSFEFQATGSPSFSNVSYKGGLEADVAKDVLAFASISTGYHAGGVFEGPPPGDTYKPEKITDYEVGLKSRFLDSRLQVNIDAYHYNYTDYQSTQIIPPFIVAIFNAKKAVANGTELEATFLATPDDVINATAAYEDAHFQNFVVPSPPYMPSGGTPVPGGVSYNGDGLPFVSKWSAILGYQHLFHLGSGAVITPGVNSSLKTSQTSGTGQAHVPGYTRSDLTLSYTSPNERWQLLGYLRNVEGRADITAISTIMGNSYASLEPPRTYGFRLSFKY